MGHHSGALCDDRLLASNSYHSRSNRPEANDGKHDAGGSVYIDGVETVDGTRIPDFSGDFR